MKLSHRRILITGATGGIGQAIAHTLAAKGNHLILHGRDQAALTALQQTLANPQQHQIWVADLTSHKILAEQLELIIEQQPIDILINNAGANHFAWLEDQTEQQITQQLSLNIQTPILLTQALLPHLNKPGIIMNIGSSFGSIGYAGYSVYCATKFALRGFSEALNRELNGSGLSVLYLAPRATKTTLNSDAVYAMNAELGAKADSPEYVAQQVITALEQECSQRYLGWPERFFVKLNALFPRVVDKALAKQQHIIAKYARISVGKKEQS